MKAKVNEFIRNCTTCIALSDKNEDFMHTILKGNVSFSTIYVDHFGPVDRTNAMKKYIFLVIDAFIKFVKLYAIKTITSRETI